MVLKEYPFYQNHLMLMRFLNGKIRGVADTLSSSSSTATCIIWTRWCETARSCSRLSGDMKWLL
ncbi:hypothetical protein RO07_25120 [Pandoraea pulmonicola]|uniref:Uncharacterized protein n=1 Tax=Pandoraea pulmonicola TaxID=93221 RepID=A0ABM6FRW5_PANPU|nr:hypothetical protein RO07_25120 [Pandoraea pulmonicola]